MITLSSRYAYVLSVALLLIAIPAWYHAIASPRAFSCSDPDTLFRSQSLPRVATYEPLPVQRRYFLDSAKGTLSLPGRWKVTPQWRITRTDHLERYYFNPHHLPAKLMPDDKIELRTVMVEGVELPIHLRWDESQKDVVISAYLYILDGRPIQNPFTGAAAAAASQLVNGRSPLTAILVTGTSSKTFDRKNRDALVDWLESAWIRYDEICHP